MAIFGTLMTMGLDPAVASSLETGGLSDPNNSRAIGAAILQVFAAMAASGVAAGVLAIALFPDLSERVKIDSPGHKHGTSAGIHLDD